MLKSNIHHVRAEFWIVGGRQVVKGSLHGCLECRRQDARRTEQLMGSISIHRLTPFLPPFAHTGVDFFGPMMVKVGGRGTRHEKRWGCLITCLNTRAVHLDLTNSLSTEAFMMCLSRFNSIRGKPLVIYSDNGLNFVGAERELREAVTNPYEQGQKIQDEMTSRTIEWHFSPPHGPHFGGVWERLVQSCKRAMRTTVGRTIVKDQELVTILYEVAALLNSRPLTHVSVDPDDPEPEIPNHFIFRRPMPYSSLMETDETENQLSRKQYEHSQIVVVSHF